MSTAIKQYNDYTPVNITNDQFLAEMYAGHTGHVLVCSFLGNPREVPAASWMPRAYTPGDTIWNAMANNYGVLSTFRNTSRSQGNHVAMHLLMLDDIIVRTDHVGGKVDVDLVKLPPTSLVETSPGNAQGLYLLAEPITDEGIASRLVERVGNKLGSGDAAGSNRYYKLPVGRNGKPAAENWENVLLEYDPNCIYTLADICSAYDIPIEEVLTPPKIDPVDLDKYPDGGPIVEALEWYSERNGVIRRKDTAQGAKYDVLCPWQSDHGHAADLTGATIGSPGTSTKVPGFWFKCHHGHCNGTDGNPVRGLNDFMRYCREEGFSDATSAMEDFDLEEVAPPPPAVTGWTDELLNAPGLVGEVADYARRSAHKPQPALALMAGLTALSAATANRYHVQYWATRLNLFTVAVVPTGGGKDRPARVAMEVAALNPQVQSINDCASGAALLRALHRGGKNLLLWRDEVWQMIEAINSKNGQSHQKELGAVLMSLYGSAGSVMHGKAYANSRENIDSIPNPYVVFSGATTPQRFADALTNTQVADGLLNRMIVFRSDEVPASVLLDNLNRPESITAGLAAMEFQTATPEDPCLIKVNDDAKARLIAWSAHCDAQVAAAQKLSPLWSRGLENALKVAGVIAVGVDCMHPVITDKIALLAQNLIAHCLTSLSGALEVEMSETDFDKQCKRAAAFIRDARRYSTDQRFGKWCKRGLMPRGKLTKLMALKPRELDEVMDYLGETGEFGKHTDKPVGRGKPSTLYAPLVRGNSSDE
jgi:Protein of unknown function (DUF3987)